MQGDQVSSLVTDKEKYRSVNRLVLVDTSLFFNLDARLKNNYTIDS